MSAAASDRSLPRPGDVYPSRVGGGAAVTERKDPVVYASPRTGVPGPLRPPQLLRFEREGFLFFDRLLSEGEAQGLAEELRQEVSRREGDASPEVIREPDGEEIRSIFRVHRDHPTFARLAADRRLVGVAEQILGSRVYVHQSRANLKPGFDGKEFYWHSDFETWHVEDGMPRMRALSVSINLTDNHPFNGPLMVMPGSHRHYVSCPGTTPKDHHRVSLRKQEYGVPDRETLRWLAEREGIEAPTGPAGSVVFFDCNAMHGSNGNITPYPRSNVFFVYNSVENGLVEPFGGLEPRPEYIASRDFRPIGTD
ncbi:MAG: ectoine hydroxylase [Myxococcota bacterium]